MLNDCFAVTRLHLSFDDDREHFHEILDTYASRDVKRVILACDFNDDESPSMHLSRRREMSNIASKISAYSHVHVHVVSAVTVEHGISQTAALERLSYELRGESYIFLRIPPTTDSDMIPAELHGIIYRRKLIPVIVNAERAIKTVPDRAANSLLAIPRAVYQIDMSSLYSPEIRRFVRKLIIQNKSVVFGSGTKFDSAVYASENYTKYLIQTVCADPRYTSLGQFALAHNRILE